MTQENKPAQILIVDDHPLLRKGVAQLIELEESLETAGEASNGKDAVSIALELGPDLILLDLNMTGMDGIATLYALRNAGVSCRIVVFTVSDSEEDVVSALKAGADGYLLKDMEPEALVENLKQAAGGKMVLSEKLNTVLANALREKPKKAEADIRNLTKREQQILKHICNGLSNKLIARELDITEGTVKVHVKHLLKKLKLRSRVEAAVWSIQHKT